MLCFALHSTFESAQADRHSTHSHNRTVNSGHRPQHLHTNDLPSQRSGQGSLSHDFRRPPPSPPVSMNKPNRPTRSGSPDRILSTSADQSGLTRNLFTNAAAPVRVGTMSKDEFEASRLRAKYLRSLKFREPTNSNIPLSTTGSKDSETSTTRAAGGKPPVAKSMGSLQQFHQDRRRTVTKRETSQPVQIQPRGSETILGFWDRPKSLRRRHTTGGSPSPSRSVWSSSGSGSRDGDSLMKSRIADSRTSDSRHDSDSMAASHSAGRGSSGTYLTAAALSRSRGNRGELDGHDRLERSGLLAANSVESESAVLLGELTLEDEDLDDTQLDDQLMFTDDPGSPAVGPSPAGALGLNSNYTYSSHQSDDGISRSSVTDDSDTEGYGASDNGHSSSGPDSRGVPGRSRRYVERGRRRRHSVDGPFAFDEEGSDPARRSDGFIPPHMMAEQQQRNCFSMGYQRHFRPKPKEF